MKLLITACALALAAAGASQDALPQWKKLSSEPYGDPTRGKQDNISFVTPELGM